MKKNVLPSDPTTAARQDRHHAEKKLVDHISDIHTPEESINPEDLEATPFQASNITVHSIDRNKPVGRIPYEQGVTPTGGKTVSIPILTAPAVFAPQIALTYNSQTGNGVAGFGWNIAGVSAITAVNRTIHFDGATAPIDIVNQVERGAFALDGVRLVRTDNRNEPYDTPRFPNFHYETAQGYVLVRRTEIAGSAITEFEALYPDGSRAFYRNDNDPATRHTYPLRWMIDKNGNRIDFEYKFSGNMFFVSEIRYGGREEGAHPSKITFTYSDNRTDFSSLYIAGIEVRQNQLLTSITSCNDEEVLRTYELAHELPTGVNQLVQLDCSTGPAAEKNYLNPLTFAYSHVNSMNFRETRRLPLPGLTINNTNRENKYSRGKMLRGSFADGLLAFPDYPTYDVISPGTLFGSLMPPETDLLIFPRLVSSSHPITIKAEAGFQLLEAVDVDGDGVDEVVRVNSSVNPSRRVTTLTIAVYRITSVATALRHITIEVASDEMVGTLRSPISLSYYFGDFRGDGRTQLLAVSHNRTIMSNQPRQSFFVLIDLDTGESIIQTDLFGHPRDEQPFVHAFDVDGDGKTELCHATASGYDVYGFDGTQFVRLRDRDNTIQRVNFTNNRTGAERPLFSDLTGDGKLDIIIPPRFSINPAHRTWTILRNTGRGFRIEWQDIVHIERNDRVILTDMNQDGRSDLIHIRNRNMRLHLNSNGSIEATSSMNPIFLMEFQSAQLPASNVDNFSSPNALIHIAGGHAQVYSFTRDESRDNLLMRMTDSYGMGSHNSYQNMIQSGSHRPGSARTYPFASVIFPLQLLRSVIIQEEDGYSWELKNNRYIYQGAVANREGLGFCGFERMDMDMLDCWGRVDRRFEEHRNPEMLGVVTDTVSPFETAQFTWVPNEEGARMNPRLTTSQATNRLTHVTTHYLYSSYDEFNNPKRVDIRFGGNTANQPFRTEINQEFFIPTAAQYIIGQLLTRTTIDTRQGLHQQWMANREVITSKKVIIYDTNRRPISLTSFTGAGTAANHQTGITEWEYDANGNITSERSAPLNVTTLIGNTFVYDSSGRRVLSVTNALGQTTHFSYHDKYGNAQTITDHQGRVTQRAFNDWGQLTEVIHPTGTVETMAVNWGGQSLYFVEKTATGQPTIIIHYDEAERVVRESNSRFENNNSWQHIDYEYDGRSRLGRVSLPFKSASPTSWNTYTYDNFDRVTELREASGRVSSWVYNGLSTTETVNGIATTKTVDVAGRLTIVSDSVGTIRYNMRADGQPISIVTQQSVTTHFNYDAFGRQISINDPSAGTQTFEHKHTPAGEFTHVTRDETNRPITSIFDRLGRILRVNRPESEFNTEYEYNANGLLISETSTNGTSTTFTYDRYDRPATIRENGLDDRFLQKEFTYNADGNVATIRYTARAGTVESVIGTEQFIYTRGYNTERRFNNISFWKLGAENELGQPTAATTGNLKRTYSYTPHGFPTGRTAGTIQNLATNFDVHRGNLSSRTDLRHSQTETFGYDVLNRLSNTPAGAINYAPNGNILFKEGIGILQYNNPERPHQLTELNAVSDNVPMRNQQVTYTSFQRPATITENNVTAAFAYNAGGERVRMQVTQGTNILLTRHYIGKQYEQDVQTNVERLYLGGDAYSAPAVFIRQGTGAWSMHYILRDHLGSIMNITNAGGTPLVNQERSYDAWGRLRNPANHVLLAPDAAPAILLGRGFTGHEHLPWFGLINCNARLYDPAIGRFLSPDPFIQNPLLSQNFNRYTYALNNPLRFTDPTGLWILLDSDDPDFLLNLRQWLEEHGGAQEADDCFSTGFANDDDVTWHFGVETLFVTGSRDNWSPIRSSGNWGTGFGFDNDGSIWLPPVVVTGRPGGGSGTQGQTAGGDFSRTIIRGIYTRRFESTRIIRVDRRWMSGGIALPGIGIIVCYPMATNRYFLRHEYGHFLQRRDLGWFAYWGFIAPLSLRSATFDWIFGTDIHRWQWYEIDANRRAYEYFGSPNWPDGQFPRNPRRR